MPKTYNPAYIDLWMASYYRDANHALRDAHTNLKGFTRMFTYYLKTNDLTTAFRRAVTRCI